MNRLRYGRHPKHIFMGAGQYDNKHGVGIMLHKRWRKRVIDTEYFNKRAITATIFVNRQHIDLMSVYFPRSKYADHHVEKMYKIMSWQLSWSTCLGRTHAKNMEKKLHDWVCWTRPIRKKHQCWNVWVRRKIPQEIVDTQKKMATP